MGTTSNHTARAAAIRSVHSARVPQGSMGASTLLCVHHTINTEPTETTNSFTRAAHTVSLRWRPRARFSFLMRAALFASSRASRASSMRVTAIASSTPASNNTPRTYADALLMAAITDNARCLRGGWDDKMWTSTLARRGTCLTAVETSSVRINARRTPRRAAPGCWPAFKVAKRSKYDVDVECAKRANTGPERAAVCKARSHPCQSHGSAHTQTQTHRHTDTHTTHQWQASSALEDLLGRPYGLFHRCNSMQQRNFTCCHIPHRPQRVHDSKRDRCFRPIPRDSIDSVVKTTHKS